MKELVLFMSSHCPDCPPVVKRLDEENISYRKVDITSSMADLKEFLKVRDVNPYFDQIKKENRVGVPTLMDGDGNLYDPEALEDFSIFK